MSTKRFLPFLRPMLSYAAGVLIHPLFHIPYALVLAISVIVCFLYVFVFTYKKHFLPNKSLALGILSVLIFFSFAKLRSMQHQEYLNEQLIDDLPVQKYIVQITELNSSTSYTGKLIYFTSEGLWSKKRIPVVLFSTSPLDIKVREQLLFYGKPKRIQSPQNPYEFDYAAFQANQGVFYQQFLQKGQYEKLTALAHQSWYDPTQLRDYFGSKLSLYITDKNALDIAMSLLLGKKGVLGGELKSQYATAGVIHVLAVSGLHVGVIYFYLLYAFSFFFGNRKKVQFIKYPLLILSVWSYTFLTGLSLPCIRASIMLTAFIVAELFNKKASSINILCFTVLVLLMYNPLYLLSISFQYSFLAIGGILCLYPYISKWFSPNSRLLQKVWQTMAVSISAQVFLFPLSIYYFHQFPNYFLLNNVLVLPLVTVIVPFGFFFFLLSPFSVLQQFVGGLLGKSIELLNLIVQWSANLPWATSDALVLNKWQCLLLTLFMVVVVRMFISKNKSYAYHSLGISFILFLTFIYREYQVRTQEVMVQYAIPSYHVVDIILGEHRFTVAYEPSESLSSKITRSVEPYRLMARANISMQQNRLWKQNDDYALFCYKGKSYFFPKRKPYFDQFLNVNYLSLLSTSQYSHKVKAEKIFFHARNNYSDHQVYSLSKDGAVISKLD